jgi:hypothetical protein
MPREVTRVQIDSLPLTDNGGLKVELVPMPAGDNPWRNRSDYLKEQRRDTIRFWMTIGTLVTSILSVVATAAIAIETVKSLS